MKKILILSMLAGGLLALNQQSWAQLENPTKATATKEKGYTLINGGEAINIYKYVHRAHSPKEAEKYAPKYFFALGSSDALQPLTKMDLKKAFPTNHPFHDALDENFREDKELTLYDEFHKMYKVNWLLKNHS